MQKLFVTRSVLCLALFGATACGGLPAGVHVRVASASAADLQRAESSGDRVYYEFEAGDEVPLVLATAGLFQAEGTPVVVRARRRFSVLIEPNGTMYFVLDGRSLTPAQVAAQWTMVFAPAPDGSIVTGIVIGLGSDADIAASMR